MLDAQRKEEAGPALLTRPEGNIVCLDALTLFCQEPSYGCMNNGCTLSVAKVKAACFTVPEPHRKKWMFGHRPAVTLSLV